jgi:hypothetical protein
MIPLPAKAVRIVLALATIASSLVFTAMIAVWVGSSSFP